MAPSGDEAGRPCAGEPSTGLSVRAGVVCFTSTLGCRDEVAADDAQGPCKATIAKADGRKPRVVSRTIAGTKKQFQILGTCSWKMNVVALETR